jgi:molybdenum cofactor guanylyltransferase
MVDVSCAILAGGRSRRMGEDKATLLFDGATLTERVYERAKRIFRQVFLVSSQHKVLVGLDIPVVADCLPAKSPLVGIASALLHADTPYVFVLGCDMPYIREEGLLWVMNQAQGEDVVIPRTAKGLEPLHAVYSKACLAPALCLAERGRLRIADLLPYVKVKELKIDGSFNGNGLSVFTNINSREDLSHFACYKP